MTFRIAQMGGEIELHLLEARQIDAGPWGSAITRRGRALRDAGSVTRSAFGHGSRLHR